VLVGLGILKSDVRPIVTILLIVLTGCIGTADVLACSDGCVSATVGSSPLDSDTGCILCHGGFTFGVYAPQLVSAPIVLETVIPLNNTAIIPPLSDIEHPPRQS
jgi:hypothetical protein